MEGQTLSLTLEERKRSRQVPTTTHYSSLPCMLALIVMMRSSFNFLLLLSTQFINLLIPFFAIHERICYEYSTHVKRQENAK